MAFLDLKQHVRPSNVALLYVKGWMFMETWPEELKNNVLLHPKIMVLGQDLNLLLLGVSI